VLLRPPRPEAAIGKSASGPEAGKVILPGDAQNSILYQRITGAGDQPRMPMGAKPLDPQQIAIIKS
jgi:hypothetical protein